MGFLSSGSTIEVTSYLTRRGRELYFLGDDKDVIVKGFALGDSDTNYNIASNDRLIEDRKNYLDNGLVPDMTGDYEGCVRSMVGEIRWLINKSSTPKGTVISQFCQPPYTLIQEISNGDGTTYYTSTQNSLTCGFVFKSKVFSRSFTKTNCITGGIGQSYLVSTILGQFTGLTQDSADQLALDYLTNNGQTIANANGTCLFTNSYKQLTFFRQGCPNGARPYSVVAYPNTQFSTISVADADNKAILYLNTNGQSIANINGTCKVLTSYGYTRNAAFKTNYTGIDGNGTQITQNYNFNKNITIGSNSLFYNGIFQNFSLGTTTFPKEGTTFNQIVSALSPPLTSSIEVLPLGSDSKLTIPQTFLVSFPPLNDKRCSIYFAVTITHKHPKIGGSNPAPNNYIDLLFVSGYLRDSVGNSINIIDYNLQAPTYSKDSSNIAQSTYIMYINYDNPNSYNINSLDIRFNVKSQYYLNTGTPGRHTLFQDLKFYNELTLAVTPPIYS